MIRQDQNRYSLINSFHCQSSWPLISGFVILSLEQRQFHVNEKQGTHEQYDLMPRDPEITITDFILTHLEPFWEQRIKKTIPAPKKLVQWEHKHINRLYATL